MEAEPKIKKYSTPSILGPEEIRQQFIDMREGLIDLYEETLKLYKRLEKVERRVGILEIQERRKRLEQGGSQKQERRKP